MWGLGGLLVYKPRELCFEVVREGLYLGEMSAQILVAWGHFDVSSRRARRHWSRVCGAISQEEQVSENVKGRVFRGQTRECRLILEVERKHQTVRFLWFNRSIRSRSHMHRSSTDDYLEGHGWCEPELYRVVV